MSLVPIDICSMLFAREFIFVPRGAAMHRSCRALQAGDLNIHCRLDCSPQFNKNMLLAETDIHRIPEALPYGRLQFDMVSVITHDSRSQQVSKDGPLGSPYERLPYLRE